MITLGDLLETINYDEWVTIKLRNEETNELLNWWYGPPSLLLTSKEAGRLCHAFVDEIAVSMGDILITILMGAEG